MAGLGLGVAGVVTGPRGEREGAGCSRESSQIRYAAKAATPISTMIARSARKNLPRSERLRPEET